MIIKPADRYLLFDESGNLGSSGRYFVIACIDTENVKALSNIMKRKLGKAKLLFPELGIMHANEIKAKDAYPAVKYHILESIALKDLSVSFIVADKKHVIPRLLKDKNIFYNYMMKILVTHLVKDSDAGRSINIVYDNHTTKVGSVNSLEEYLKLTLVYEKDLNVELIFQSMDSDDGNAYPVQAADYVANAIYGHYEYNEQLLYSKMSGLLQQRLHFPLQEFGR